MFQEVTFQARNMKKTTLKLFLIFQEMELSCRKLKNSCLPFLVEENPLDIFINVSSGAFISSMVFTAGFRVFSLAIAFTRYLLFVLIVFVHFTAYTDGLTKIIFLLKCQFYRDIAFIIDKHSFKNMVYRIYCYTNLFLRISYSSIHFYSY